MAFNPNQPRDKNGEWTGAGGASGSHAAGINNVGKASVSDRVLDVIRKNPGGFSVTPKGDIPSKGYMVSMPGRSLILGDNELHGKAAQGIINDYARKNADVLKMPGAHIGGWRDNDTGKTHLDVSHNIPRVRDAVKAGKARNQIAIWDVKRSREIRTGGSGDK